MSCYGGAHPAAVPNTAFFLAFALVADAECHVLSSRINSTFIPHQPAYQLSI
jgi:hypothetical protein